jgi:hypothetical protein
MLWDRFAGPGQIAGLTPHVLLRSLKTFVEIKYSTIEDPESAI